MKKIRIISTAMLLVLFILGSSHVFAENTRIGPAEQIQAGYIRGGADTSVKVVKYADDEEIVVFQGLLSDYDNGAWTCFDFSQTAFAVILDWDTNETLYIVPINDNAPQKILRKQQNKMSTLSVVQPALTIAASYYVNNSELNDTEIDIAPGDSIRADYSITNQQAEAQDIELVIALYSADHKLVDINTVSDTIPANTSKTITNTLTAEGGESYAKVFLWESFGGLAPLYSVVQIGNVPAAQIVSAAEIDCAAGKEYNLVLTVENMPVNDSGAYTVRYDPAKLSVLDLSSLTYKRELETGTIAQCNINITGFDPQEGRISFSNSNEETEMVSKVLNSIRFKGLVSDVKTIVTIE